jgi:hypothetical protein
VFKQEYHETWVHFRQLQQGSIGAISTFKSLHHQVAASHESLKHSGIQPPYNARKEWNVSGQQAQKIKRPCLLQKSHYQSKAMSVTCATVPVTKQEDWKPIANVILISPRTCICTILQCLSTFKRWVALGD